MFPFIRGTFSRSWNHHFIYVHDYSYIEKEPSFCADGNSVEDFFQLYARLFNSFIFIPCKMQQNHYNSKYEHELIETYIMKQLTIAQSKSILLFLNSQLHTKNIY